MASFAKLGNSYVNLDCVRKIDLGRPGSIGVHLNGEQPFTVDGPDADALLALIASQASAASAAPKAGIKELAAPR